MLIKDILVHVETSPAGDSRLQLAIHLARRFDAALTGAMVLPALDVLALADSGPVLVELAAELAAVKEEAAATGERFMMMLQRHGVPGEWRTARGAAVSCITRWARAVDLLVLGQADPDHPTELDAPEDVILACGRPVLVVPYAGRFDRIGETVLVAWNASREATRAAHEALPLMAMSNSVTVLSAKLGAQGDEPGADLVRHFARHGLNAKAEAIEAQDIDVSAALLSRAADLGADLIVMGAYGHSRVRETVLGGTTRAMLRHMTLPTLMAH